jgi:predicted tellurium resistance membrane protein TerC
LIYALFGVGVLYWAKSELSKFSQAFPLFGIALSLTFAMIFLDLLTDTREFFDWLITNDSIAYIVHKSFSIFEECCKIFAEGMFIIALYCCLQISKKQKYFSKELIKENSLNR